MVFPNINSSHFIIIFLMFIYSWERQRQKQRETETDREQGGGRERGRHRTWSRLHALSCQHRAWCRAWTHEPHDHDLNWSCMLNRLNPGSPKRIILKDVKFPTPGRKSTNSRTERKENHPLSHNWRWSLLPPGNGVLGDFCLLSISVFLSFLSRVLQ